MTRAAEAGQQLWPGDPREAGAAQQGKLLFSYVDKMDQQQNLERTEPAFTRKLLSFTFTQNAAPPVFLAGRQIRDFPPQ